MEQNRGGRNIMLKRRMGRIVSGVSVGLGEDMGVADLLVFCVTLPLNIYTNGTHHRKQVCRGEKLFDEEKNGGDVRSAKRRRSDRPTR